MARKIQQVVIDTPGRDQNKVFLLREMPTRQSEWWGARLLSAMARSGVDIPADIGDAGLAGVAAIGVRVVLGSIGMAECKPLLDEMFDSCVSFIPDPQRPNVTRGPGGVGPLIEDDIEELSTIARLRKEVLLMHLDFLPPAARSILDKVLGMQAGSQTT